MTQDYEDKSLEDWANFNFAEADNPSSASSEQTALPDAFVEDDNGVSADDSAEAVTVEAEVSEVSETQSEEASGEPNEMMVPPAYQGLEIPIAEVPLYKRPHLKAVFFGSGALMVAIAVGALFARGSNLQLGQQSEAPTQVVSDAEEKSEEELAQEKVSQLEGEVAFGTLKNRAQILEEQKKQKILSGKLEEQAEEEQANGSASNTVRLPSRPTPPPSRPPSFPRLPVSPPPTRVVAPVARPSTGSTPPGSLSSSPATRRVSPPPAPVPPAAPSRVVSQPPEPPTMLSFGAMPSSESDLGSSGGASAPSSFGGFETVAQNTASQGQGSGFDADMLLAQQEDAFLSGKSQFLVESGQSLSGQVTQQIIAAQDAAFTVRVNEGVLGLPSGTEVAAQVTQFSGKYLVAEAVSIRHIDGSQTMIPPGAVTLSDSNGKLLKAKNNQGFFQGGFGKALLGAGSGIAEQLTSRSESFSQNRFGTTVTRGAGSRDLATLGSSALRGFAEPLLSQVGEGGDSSTLLLNPGQKVRLNINSSFVVSQ